MDTYSAIQASHQAGGHQLTRTAQFGCHRDLHGTGRSDISHDPANLTNDVHKYSEPCTFYRYRYLVAGFSRLFLPSFFAGTPSPVLAKTIVDLQPGREGKALGGIFATSSVGAIIGTLATGFFISWLGSTLTIVAVTALYACLAVWLLFMKGQIKHWVTIAVSLIGALVISAYNPTGQSACTRESRYDCIRAIDFTSQVGSSAKLIVLDYFGHGINLAE